MDPEERQALKVKDKHGVPAVRFQLFYLAVEGKQELERLWNLGAAQVPGRAARETDDAGWCGEGTEELGVEATGSFRDPTR